MARTIGEKRFLETLEISCARAGRLGEDVIKRDKSQYVHDRDANIAYIKKESNNYKNSVKAVKEASGIRKLIPGGQSALIDMAEAQAKSTIDKVSGYKAVLADLTEKVKEVELNEKDLAEAKKEADKEFGLVRKLVKSGFIENIRYEAHKGLFWTYPPTIYKAEGLIYFLGRPEAGISEQNGSGFSLRLPSYKVESHIGTFHMRNSTEGNDHCLGGYDDILKVLAAKRQVSSIIRIFADYFQSYNGKSKHNTPPHNQMDICLPKVIDDSWEVWKKNNPKFKMPEPATIPEPEECGDCGSSPCECEE